MWAGDVQRRLGRVRPFGVCLDFLDQFTREPGLDGFARDLIDGQRLDGREQLLEQRFE
jgi:hypothetical protein